MLKEILTAVGLSTGGFLFVMVAGNLLKGPLAEVLNGRIPWSTFFELTLLLIPGMAPYVLPIAIVAGVMIVLGRMSAQNEITAMKASGMSLWRITSPIAAIGIAGSLLAVWVNFEYAPRANDSVKRILAGALRDNPAGFIAPKTAVYDFPGYVVYADRREGDTMRDVWIWRTDKAGRDTELIRARGAKVTTVFGKPDDESDDLLRLELDGAVVERRDAKAPAPGSVPDAAYIGGFESSSLDIPLGKLLKGTESYDKKLRWNTFSELMALREKGYEVKPGATEKERFADRIKVQFQLQSNLASAFGILSLTLLAIPLGIRVSRSETFVNFAVALALALVYYLLTVCMGWIHNPYCRPDILVWLPNVVIQAIAARLLFKAAKS